ncbi:hypothetical protein D3C78_817280 [compost metagenome]
MLLNRLLPCAMLGGELSCPFIEQGLHGGQMAGEALLESIQRRADSKQLGSVRQSFKGLIVDEGEIGQAIAQVCKHVAKALHAISSGLGYLSLACEQ